jgi:Tfp pilus assembly protein PilF
LVEVLEGVVAVRQGAETREVRGGRRLLVSQVGMAEGSVDEERAGGIRQAVRRIPVVGLEALEPSEQAASDPEAPAIVSGRAAPMREARAPGSEPESDAEDFEAPSESPGDLLARAEKLRRAGKHDEARSLYRVVGAGSGATAEAAWLALARMELGTGNAAGAQRAASERRARFGGGSLGPEARWIDVRTYRLAGDESAARRAARDLVARWPRSPQADAARRWLDGVE